MERLEPMVMEQCTICKEFFQVVRGMHSNASKICPKCKKHFDRE